MRLNAVSGVEVSIRHSGAAAQEYDGEAGPYENDTKGKKYVEAISGAHFKASLKAERSKLGGDHGNQLSCHVYLDGQRVCKKILDVYCAPSYSKTIVGRDCTMNGQRYLQKFAFADLNTNDGPVDEVKNTNFKHLGKICVKLYFVRQVSSKVQRDRPIKDTKVTTIPEKCLKGQAISRQAALSEPEPIAGTGSSIHVEHPYGKHAFATFVFKYRSRKDLQIEGIIPRSPSPTPLEERDPNELSPEEARELVRRMRAREQDDNFRVKKEKREHAALVDDDEDEEITISQVRNSKRARTLTDSGVEVIDLSGD